MTGVTVVSGNWETAAGFLSVRRAVNIFAMQILNRLDDELPMLIRETNIKLIILGSCGD